MANAVVPSLDAVPESIRSLAEKQADGTFALPLEKLASAASLAEAHGKVVEFRDTNVKILKALGVESVDQALPRAAAFAGIDTAKLEKLKAIDPDRYAALEATAAKLKDKGLENAEQVDARLQAMLDAALAPVKADLATEKAGRASEKERADKATLRQVIGERFSKAGGKASALDFIVDRAPFRIVEGAVKAAENKFSTTNPGKPLEIEEWLAGATKEFDFAFEPSKGGGAAGGNGNGAPAGGPHTGPFRTSTGAELKVDGITVLS